VKVLVTGVSGYVGSALVPRLQRDGHDVRGFARDPARVSASVPVVGGDAVSGAGLAEAFEGIELAYYLIHSMEPSSDGSFAQRELRAARHVVRAAREAGVRRVVYLGGLVPAAEHAASAHLGSRHAVEEAILGGISDSVALRASIVIGARSRSFRFLVRLVERLPILALPGWREHRTRPIDGRDVLEYLARAATLPEAGGRSLDIAGPDLVSYAGLIERIRDSMLVPRPAVRLGRLNLTPVASRVAAAIAGEEHALIGPLMEGLESDLLPRDDGAAALFGLRLHSLDAAIERALREWEATETLAAR